MKIAPGVQVADWKALDLSQPDSPDWDRAISIFELRIRSRFVDVVDFLLAEDKQRAPTARTFGFAILSIDCLVVETLEAFRQGRTDTRGKSEQLCTTFLSQRPSLRSYFAGGLAARF
jgi:hypothetical protein